MPTPLEVQYKNAVIRDKFLDMNIRNLQFTVVNNPKPTPYFEDLPTVEVIPDDNIIGPGKTAVSCFVYRVDMYTRLSHSIYIVWSWSNVNTSRQL